VHSTCHEKHWLTVQLFSISFTVNNTTAKKIWVQNMQCFMYFRRAIECRFPIFTYTYRFLIISVVYLSRVVVKRIVGSRNLILLSPTRFAIVRGECATMSTLVLRKLYVQSKNENRHSIPRRKYIINRIFAPQIFSNNIWLSCSVMIHGLQNKITSECAQKQSDGLDNKWSDRVHKHSSSCDLGGMFVTLSNVILG